MNTEHFCLTIPSTELGMHGLPLDDSLISGHAHINPSLKKLVWHNKFIDNITSVTAESCGSGNLSCILVSITEKVWSVPYEQWLGSGNFGSICYRN